MSTTTATPPKAFIWRRIHSLMGLWFVLFLMEHLLTNSQAALWIGDNGNGFVRMVNWLHNLPYLQVVEAVLIGVPILVHGVLGVKYLFTSKANSYKSDGSKPSLPEYGRNRAYTWQRITSWILLFLIVFHVVKFRFIEYPNKAHVGGDTYYFIRVSQDPGLPSVASRLHVNLFDEAAIEEQTLQKGRDSEWVKGLRKRELKPNHVIAETPDFGTATLLAVRNTFKHPFYVGLYTVFVLAACFHAFNGFWTFLISWGVIFKMAAQKTMVKVALVLMAIFTFLGLIAIWGTYWLNLKS